MSESNNGGPAFPKPHHDSISGMSLREYAAIKLKVPKSGTDWLDEMIMESLRDDFAAMVTFGPYEVDDEAIEAYKNADALIKARGSNED